MHGEWWVIRVWNDSPIELLARVFWVIFSITLHELAHGWTALRSGDRTPADTGHMTWNPVVHMGQMGLLMFALAGIAWGAMPIDPTRFRGRYDEAKVALAGPSANILLFAIAIGISAAIDVWGGSIARDTRVHLLEFFLIGAWLNVALTALNLLPFPPLDGWRILSNLVPSYGRLWGSPNAAMFAVVVFVAVFFFGGKYIFRAAEDVTIHAYAAVVRAMGKPFVLP